MSEYQYYEFISIDNPLSRQELAELRAVSTRADISSTRFVNEYNWSDLRASPPTLMERYFDAHLYVANWGSRTVIFRFPLRAVPLSALEPYQASGVRVWATQTHSLVELDRLAEDDDGSCWDDKDALIDLLPLRQQILAGDLRCLYLAWLSSAMDDYHEDEQDERHGCPPVPPGLEDLGASLERFTELFRFDADLIRAIAQHSAPLTAPSDQISDLAAFISALDPQVKVALLLRVAQQEPTVSLELMADFRSSLAASTHRPPCPTPPLADLADATLHEEHAREVREAEARRLEHALRAEREEKRRQARRDEVNRAPERLWGAVDTHIAASNRKSYQCAAALLADLLDAATTEAERRSFQSRLIAIRLEHERKRALMEELVKAGVLKA